MDYVLSPQITAKKDLSWYFPVLGHSPQVIWEMIKSDGNSSQALFQLLQESGKNTINLNLMGKWTVLTTDPGLANRVLVKEVEHYPKTEWEARVLSPMMKDGMILLKGRKWKNRRKLLAPYFNNSYMESLIPLASASARMRIKKWNRKVNAGKEMCAIALDTLCQYLTTKGHIGTFENEKSLDEYIDILHGLEKRLEKRVYPSLYWVQNLLEFFPKRSMSNEIKPIDDMLRNRVEKMKTSAKEDTLISALIKDSPDVETVINELKSMTSAGMTTSHLLTWTCYLLAKNQNVQTEIRKEIKKTLGAKKSISSMTSKELEAMTYTDAVLHEVLRMYPPAPLLLRSILKNGKSLNGKKYNFHTPVQVMISLWGMHRDPEIWDNPDEFNPERWLNTDAAKLRKMFKHFMPFGDGPRACIGKKFSIIESKIIIMEILTRHNLSLAKKERKKELAARTDILTRPGHAVHILARPLH